MWLCFPIIQMSSNKFLQRFEGKIQVVGKEGVHNVFGGKSENVVVYTNNNFNPQPKNKTSSSLNKPKPQQPENPKEKRTSLKKLSENKEKKEIKNPPPPAPKEKKSQNPFLVSNPFYLDEEDKQKIEEERKEREKQEKELEREIQINTKDSKKNTTASLNRSLEKKKNQKEWVKLGGLGANIGGDEWVEKKKKIDKMQQFSEQVKMINNNKPKVPKPVQKEERKEVNARQKALEYSKNVPKPPVRSVIEKLEEPQQKTEVQKELSELQQYEMRHEQLKNMLRNQW